MKFDPDYLFPSEKNYLDTVLNKISILTGVPKNIITGDARSRKVIIARHLYFYIANKYKPLELSLERIGSLINSRDHASVIHGIKKIETDIDLKFKPTLMLLKKFHEISTITSEYKLSWKTINLIDILKTGEKIKLDVMEEEYIV